LRTSIPSRRAREGRALFDDYLLPLRIATKPAIAKSVASRPIANSESVGMELEVVNGAAMTTTDSFAALHVFAVGALLRSPP